MIDREVLPQRALLPDTADPVKRGEAADKPQDPLLLSLIHIFVDVERTDGISSVICFFEHFGGVYQWHSVDLLSFYARMRITT